MAPEEVGGPFGDQQTSAKGGGAGAGPNWAACRSGGGGPSERAAYWASLFRLSVASVQSAATTAWDNAFDPPAAPRLAPGLQCLRLAGTKLPVARVPGIGIYYNELLTGVPPVLVSLGFGIEG